MFTIKYRTFERAHQQNAAAGSPTYYDEHEQIHGPFALISKETDENGYPVVHAHRSENEPGMTFTHSRIRDLEDQQVAGQPEPPAPLSTLWVMNEQGATIAKYDL